LADDIVNSTIAHAVLKVRKDELQNEHKS